jgi:hypothetical protein
VVVRRSGEGLHLGAGLDEALPRDLRKGLAADHGIVHLVVEEDLNGLPEVQGRGIQILKGPQPLVFALSLRVMENIGDDEVEQIQGIIHRDDFEGMGKGEQGGEAALGRHAGNGLGTCSGDIAG